MAKPYKIAYSHEEKAQIDKELKALMKRTKTDHTHRIDVRYKKIRGTKMWEFYVVPK